MNTIETENCMFVGLPASGKSSFIGAFWHVVDTGEIDANFIVDVPPSEREYLNMLQSNFLTCTPPERTKTEKLKKLNITMRSVQTGRTVELIFPDLDGEMYKSQFEYRQFNEEFHEVLKGCSTVILFINPDHLNRPFLINEATDILDGLDNEVSEGENTVHLEKSRSWDIKSCQTQVVLVDLLQMILGVVPGYIRVAVIISAWDVIKNTGIPEHKNVLPAKWFMENLPLAYQFFTSHRERLPFKVYGISAQGGEYSKEPQENVTLQQFSKPSERLIIQEDKTINNDITLPFKWLFNE